MLMTADSDRHEMELETNGERIERVEQVKYFGIELDPKLTIDRCNQKLQTRTWRSLQNTPKMGSEINLREGLQNYN
jgi:hypothetical protein